MNTNFVFEPHPRGISIGRRNTNEAIRRVDNFSQPPVVPMANPPMMQPVQQPPNLVERNEIINLIHEVCGPLARGVQTPVYRKPNPD